MMNLSRPYTRSSRPCAPNRSYTQNIPDPVSPSVERAERVSRLPTFLRSASQQQALGPSTGFSSVPSQSLSLPLSIHSVVTEELSEGQVVEPDVKRSKPRNFNSKRITPNPEFSTTPLSINNTAQMYELMEFTATPRHCKSMVETIQGLISYNKMMSPKKKKLETDLLAEYLFYWTSMTLHPFMILICTIYYIELLKALHPNIIFTGKLRDAMLRVMFSAFLISTKMVSDVCYANVAFICHTPWTLEEVNSMEVELLGHIQYKSYIPPDYLLRRAKPFWAQFQESMHASEHNEASLDTT